jgi:hypothetical protein
VLGRLETLVPARIRGAALMPAAVLTVHQLRYQLAFGGHADTRLAAEGHAYLGPLAPLAAMLVAIGAGVFLAGLARAHREGEAGEGRRRPFVAVWLLAAAALLGIYAAQELAEGFFASGHPEGLVGVFGNGGLWAVPLSLALGAAVAGALRFTAVARRWAAARGQDEAPPRAARPRRSRRPVPVFRPVLAPLARRAAGRAPPVAAALNA